MIPDSIKMPKMWAVRSQETLKVRTDGEDGGCVPGEDGWELYPSRWETLAVPLQLCHGQQVRGWERGVQGMSVERCCCV